MNGAIALLALGVVGGGLYFAAKAKAESERAPVSYDVTGQSGSRYLVEFVGSRSDSVGEIDIYAVRNDSDQLLMVYQQYRGNNATRIWDKAQSLQLGAPEGGSEFMRAAQDFGVFISV